MSDDCCEITVVETVNNPIYVTAQAPNQIVIEEIVDDFELNTTITQITITESPPAQIVIASSGLQGPRGIQGIPGEQGEPGIQGPPGADGGASATGIAGENISVYMAIVAIGGQLFKADPTNINHVGRIVGVSLQSASSGNSITYRSIGDIAGGTFNSNESYYVGLNGELSTSPYQGNFVWHQKVGVGKTGSILAVLISPAVIL